MKSKEILVLPFLVVIIVVSYFVFKSKSIVPPIVDSSIGETMVSSNSTSPDSSSNPECGTDQSVKITNPTGGEIFKIYQRIHIAWSTCNISNNGFGENTVLWIERFDASGKELGYAINIGDPSTIRLGYIDLTIPEYETFAEGDGYLVSLADPKVKYKIHIQITTKNFAQGTSDVRDARSGLFSILDQEYKTHVFHDVTFWYPSDFTLKKISKDGDGSPADRLVLCLKEVCNIYIGSTSIEANDKNNTGRGGSVSKSEKIKNVYFELGIGDTPYMSDIFDQIISSAKNSSYILNNLN